MQSGRDSLGAVFDMDGTLLDSYHAHGASWRRTMSEESIDYSDEDFHRHFGRRNEEIIRDVFERLGRSEPSPERIQAIADRKEELFRSALVHDCVEMPGARGLLERLERSGWMIAVGSSAPRENLELALELLDMNRFMKATVCGGDVSRGKPEPDVFVEAARRIGVASRGCLVFEDAPAGIEAGHRAGMAVVGIRCPHHDSQLSAADLVVDNFDECRERELRTLIKEHSP